MKKSIQFFIVLIVLTAIGAATFFAYTTYAQVDLITTDNGNGSSAQIFSELSQLSSLTLSPAIFSMPAFESLVDYTVPIVPEPVSRPNPFAPIGEN